MGHSLPSRTHYFRTLLASSRTPQIDLFFHNFFSSSLFSVIIKACIASMHCKWKICRFKIHFSHYFVRNANTFSIKLQLLFCIRRVHKQTGEQNATKIKILVNGICANKSCFDDRFTQLTNCGDDFWNFYANIDRSHVWWHPTEYAADSYVIARAHIASERRKRRNSFYEIFVFRLSAYVSGMNAPRIISQISMLLFIRFVVNLKLMRNEYPNKHCTRVLNRRNRPSVRSMRARIRHSTAYQRPDSRHIFNMFQFLLLARKHHVRFAAPLISHELWAVQIVFVHF